jgi:hypothetical protein
MALTNRGNEMNSDDIMAKNLRKLIRSSNTVYVSVPSKHEVHSVEVTKKSALEMTDVFENDEFTGFSFIMIEHDNSMNGTWSVLYIDRSI